MLLVLDDYHLVGSQPVHASVGFLLEHLPPGLHPVLASRADPPLALARLRARGQLAELRAAELRFTADEAAAMLREAAGADLPDAAVAALAARAEGWAAGLQLAGLSLRGQEDVAGFVAAFTGSHRYVLDYLAEEVLERQSEQVRAFLLETSVLERLSGALCDAVTGRTGSQALLEQVERAGLFLVPLDEVRGWWRYHHLFADLLRARLQQQQPGRVPELHHNAATWYEEHGLADDAIRHAVAAGEMSWAARLIERHSTRSSTCAVKRRRSSDGWRRCPSELVRSRPRLLLAQAQMAVGSAAVGGGGAAARRGRARVRGRSRGAVRATAGRAASLLVNVPAHDRAPDRSYRRPAPRRRRAHGGIRVAGPGRSRRGRVDGCAPIAQGCWPWPSGSTAGSPRPSAPSVSSIAGWRAAGPAHCHCMGQLSARPDPAGPGPPGRGRPDLPAGTGDHRAARPAAAAGRWPGVRGPGRGGLSAERTRHRARPCHRGHRAVPAVRLHPAAGRRPGDAGMDPAGHRAIQPARWRRSARQCGHAPGPPGLLNPVPAQRARLLLAQGDLAGAARWTQENGLAADDEPDYPREPGHLVLARVLLAEGRPGQALALLDRLHAAAAAQDRTGSLIEAGALRALALAASGEEAAAVAALAGALTLACPQGYVRVFADEGPPMAALLGRLVAAQRSSQDAAGVPLGCLARLQRIRGAEHAGRISGRTGTAAVPGLAEALTARELEVLGMLAAGRSNQVIAGELVVTLDTVKKHVSHVMDKLGAANRTEAVARARELGLIRLRGGRSRSDGTVVPGAEPRRKFAAPVRLCSFSCVLTRRQAAGGSGGAEEPPGRRAGSRRCRRRRSLRCRAGSSLARGGRRRYGRRRGPGGQRVGMGAGVGTWGTSGYVAAVIAVLGSSGSGGWR